MDPRRLAALHKALRAEMAARVPVRGRGFHGAVRRAGRSLPAGARAAAADLKALELRIANPKLAARTDPALLEAAAARFRRSLGAPGRAKRTSRARALLLAEIGFKLAVLIALGLGMLYWRAGA